MNFSQATGTLGEFQEHPNEVWLRYSYSTSVHWSKVNLLKEVETII